MRRSVVLIVNDTMRRDRVGAYGGPARTPAFDHFARTNLLFDRAVTQAPWTKPSIATLFTGLYPSQHGVVTHPAIPEPGETERREQLIETDVLVDGLTTLAEVVQGAGYETAAFVANPWLDPAFGFAQVFEHWDDSFATFDTPGDVVSRAALDWLEGREGGRPYLLYLHYIDSHGPYPRLPVKQLRRLETRAGGETDVLPPGGRSLSPGAEASLRAAVRLPDGRPAASAGIRPTVRVLRYVYDRGVEQFDRAFGVFLEGFAALPGAGETAILVTSDHGEALFERGWGGHGHGLFDDEVGVPLAARLPGVEADGPVGCPVGLVDVMATLCVYLGLECPEHDFGVSWIAPGTGGDPRPTRYLVSEAVMGKPDHRAIRNREYKLLWEPDGRRGAESRPAGGGWALFATTQDPAERSDLLEASMPGSRARAAFRTLSAATPGSVPPFDTPATVRVPMEAQTRERLEALGYLGEEP